MKSILKKYYHAQFKQIIFCVGTIVACIPFAQPLSVQALPNQRPMQFAMNDCIVSIITGSDTYRIEVCQKSNQKIEMILENNKTGEKMNLPATQIDDSGNVFSANITMRERINRKINPFLGTIPMYASKITNYELNIPKRQFIITTETKVNLPINNKKSVQVEKLGYLLMSSEQNSTFAENTVLMD
jgi:hypothetical protein